MADGGLWYWYVWPRLFDCKDFMVLPQAVPLAMSTGASIFISRDCIEFISLFQLR